MGTASIWSPGTIIYVPTGSLLVTEETTAIQGQTLFPVSTTYEPGVSSVQVYRNGVLLAKTDYTATTGTSITLLDPATANDIIAIVMSESPDIPVTLPA